jgi:hypothetical protein
VDGDSIGHSCGVGVALDLDGVTAEPWSAHHPRGRNRVGDRINWS